MVTLLNFQSLGGNVNGNDCCYMVVFQYGSIVLFNVRDNEVGGYLEIVSKHASGLLEETRKDGKTLCFLWICETLIVRYAMKISIGYK